MSAQSSPRTRERLNRFLSRAGIGSRRKADALIAAGRVSLNGVKVEKLATTVDPEHDRVALDGKVLKPASLASVWIVLNKPAGLLTARRDMRGRKTIFDLLPAEYRNLIPVGRLDYDTEGVILLTSDGDAAHRLMHPRYEIERVYEATIVRVPSPTQLRTLSRGIDLGDPTPAKAEVTVTGHHPGGAILRVVLREGRKREVKRMLDVIGHRVIHLRRVAYAGITARGLKAGEWRTLTESEVSRSLRISEAP